MQDAISKIGVGGGGRLLLVSKGGSEKPGRDNRQVF